MRFRKSEQVQHTDRRRDSKGVGTSGHAVAAGECRVVWSGSKIGRFVANSAELKDSDAMRFRKKEQVQHTDRRRDSKGVGTSGHAVAAGECRVVWSGGG